MAFLWSKTIISINTVSATQLNQNRVRMNKESKAGAVCLNTSRSTKYNYKKFFRVKNFDPLFILQKKIRRIITFSSYDKSSQFVFTELTILPLYNLIHNRIGFMMYKLVNVFLPDAMNELYTTNDQIHNHFQDNVTFFILIKDIPMFMQEGLEI